MRALEFITGHVIFKLRYNQIYQLKTTHNWSELLSSKWNFCVFKSTKEPTKSSHSFGREDTLILLLSAWDRSRESTAKKKTCQRTCRGPKTPKILFEINWPLVLILFILVFSHCAKTSGAERFFLWSESNFILTYVTQHHFNGHQSELVKYPKYYQYWVL